MIFSVILLFHKVFKSPAKFDKKACYDKEEKKRVALTKSKKKKAEETTMLKRELRNISSLTACCAGIAWHR